MINTYHTKLVQDIELTHNVHQYTFELSEGEELKFVAGQYLIMHVPRGNGEIARKLYSIASPSYQKHSFDLIIKLVDDGIGSAFLHKLELGMDVTFQGPAGMFTLRENKKPKMFLATGTGIAPIRSIILSQMRKGLDADFYLFWGLRERIDTFYHEEWDILNKKDDKLHYILCYSRENDPPATCTVCVRIDEYLRRTLKDWQEAGHQLDGFDYYICGGKTATEGLVKTLEEFHVSKDSIHFEKFV